MARTWQLGTIPVRPGTYFRTSSGDVTAVGALNGTVALLYKSNWGALNKVVDISPEELNNLKEIVGTGQGYEVARQALIGGAKILRTIRVGTDNGTASYIKLYSPDKENEVAGEEIVTISAKYVGARKPALSIKTNSITRRRQAYFYDEDLRLIDSVDWEDGTNEATSMVEAINANSKYFTAERHGQSKSRLKDCTQAEFQAGTDPTVNVAQYTAGLDVLERYRWNVVIADDSSNDIQSELISFVRQSYEVGHLGLTVLCGAKETPFDDRLAYAAAINDWRVVYLLSGWIGTDNKNYHTYLAAARLAGMIAACETNASITHLVIQDSLRPLEELTNGEMIRAEEKGCVVLSINDDDQVILDNAITTLITLGNDQDEGWKKIRRTKCRFELMTRINRTCDKLVGRLNNDARGRATIITVSQGVIGEMISEGKLFPGSYIEEHPWYKPVGDRAYFKLVIGDIDSMEKIFLDYTFSYSNPFSALDVTTSVG